MFLSELDKKKKKSYMVWIKKNYLLGKYEVGRFFF